jgi:hypothetical protein
MYNQSGTRATVYLSDHHASLIKEYAKKHKLSTSKAILELALSGFENRGGETSKVKKLEDKIGSLEEELQKYQERTLGLEKKLEQLTQQLAASRLGDIRETFIWEDDDPPQKQIPIHLWFDASHPDFKKHEKYGATQRTLLYKMFGIDGEYLFKQWCLKLDINQTHKREERIKYLEKISGAKYQTVQLPGQTKSSRYVINHLFPRDFFEETEQE